MDIYLDGEKVVADYSRNAQTVYPGTVKKYAEFAGIPEEQAQKEVKKFYNWMHVMKDHTGGLVDDIQKLKVEDSEEEMEEVKDFRVYVKKNVKDKIQKALTESEYEFEDVGDYFVVHGVRDFKKFNDYLVSYDVDFMDFLVDEEA